jgi:hypothetical protein
MLTKEEEEPGINWVRNLGVEGLRQFVLDELRERFGPLPEKLQQQVAAHLCVAGTWITGFIEHYNQARTLGLIVAPHSPPSGASPFAAEPSSPAPRPFVFAAFPLAGGSATEGGAAIPKGGAAIPFVFAAIPFARASRASEFAAYPN